MQLKNKRVLVTGADGFIGSHLTERLVEIGCNVRAFCFYNAFNSWGWLESINEKKLQSIDIFMGDVRDSFGVRRALDGVDVVFHLAALVGIPYSYYSPDAYVATNVSGTLNVLQGARDVGAGLVVVTSTSEIYGTAQYVPIDEQHPINAQSPYAATKVAAEQIALSFHRSFNLPVIVTRPFNTYGPRQSARAVIPTIITQLLSGGREVTLGNLDTTRDFTFVNDTVNAFAEIAECEKLIGEIVNIGTNAEISVGGLVSTIGEIMGVDIHVKKDQERMRPEKSEVYRLRCNNQKLTAATNWQPEYDLVSGLRETIHWIENNPRCYKAEIYNV